MYINTKNVYKCIYIFVTVYVNVAWFVYSVYKRALGLRRLALTMLSFLVGSGDIVGENMKLILGLVWTLILHYQISAGTRSLSGKVNSMQRGTVAAKQAMTDFVHVSLFGIRMGSWKSISIT